MLAVRCTGLTWLARPAVSAIDKTQVDTSTADPGPNDGSPPEQMKTTLTASIPVVAGGVNSFCDQIIAKTDLQDGKCSCLVACVIAVRLSDMPLCVAQWSTRT